MPGLIFFEAEHFPQKTAKCAKGQYRGPAKVKSNIIVIVIVILIFILRVM